MEGCQDVVYSEDFEDYIVEYSGQEENPAQFYQSKCFQPLGMGFGVIFQRMTDIVPELNDALMVRPRCFGLLSSEQVLEEVGINRVRNQPRLELFGRGVLFGIIDTGAGVRSVYK